MAAPGNTNMMGSRADMISSKFDEVARNSIWREHVTKEARHAAFSEAFVINPSTMVPITRKPTQKAEVHATADADEDFKELQATMNASLRLPQQKSKFPLTASQEVGWYWKEAQRDRFKNPRSMCSETKYAESYVQMSGSNPYAKPS